MVLICCGLSCTLKIVEIEIMILLDQYDREVPVFFETENYLVRDNGSVLRRSRPEGRKRKLDEVWTFGEENSANAYLHISGVRVHRIVATAFHGEPPDPKYVVDHIDTNCRNNRPENLRWLTRLENALKNPVTRKKIEFLCGSIEAFLENPSMLNDFGDDPNTRWMRTVSAEEARNCLARMSLWADSDKKPANATRTINYRSSFEDRVYKPLQKWEAGLAGEPGLDFAATQWCAQYMWRAQIHFPSCPTSFGVDPIEDYFRNLTAGAVFAYSDDIEISPKHLVLDAKILVAKFSIVVMSEREDGKWSIVGIELNRKRHFIHFLLSSHYKKDEAVEVFHSKNEHSNFWSEAYSNNGY